MVKVIMNFEVEDWDKWHAAFLANSKMREENDIKEIYVGHELENKNKVHVIYDTPAPDTIQKMMQKPEVQEVMKNAGNKVETMVVATCTDCFILACSPLVRIPATRCNSNPYVIKRIISILTTLRNPLSIQPEKQFPNSI